MKPQDLVYSETHEWIKVDGDVATVGITDYAIEHLSDLVFIELPQTGDDVTRGEPFGTIESVKAVSDLSAPLTGSVVEVNESLADELDTLSEDPFDTGWLIKVKLKDQHELEELLEAKAYEEHIAKEEGA